MRSTKGKPSEGERVGLSAYRRENGAKRKTYTKVTEVNEDYSKMAWGMASFETAVRIPCNIYLLCNLCVKPARRYADMAKRETPTRRHTNTHLRFPASVAFFTRSTTLESAPVAQLDRVYDFGS
jgi:hypothetical protein